MVSDVFKPSYRNLDRVEAPKASIRTDKTIVFPRARLSRQKLVDETKPLNKCSTCIAALFSKFHEIYFSEKNPFASKGFHTNIAKWFEIHGSERINVSNAIYCQV